MKFNCILSILLIIIFVFSITNQSQIITGQNIEDNFELLLMTNAGNRIRESYAFFIKQAVAPLGIDVEILAKPFGQFVGDLLHVSIGQPFDLAIIGFAGGGPTPGLMWKFHSTQSTYGQSIYQLNDPGWQDFMNLDIDIQTANVDEMLESINFELDLIERREKINDFAELYMDQLLYDFPLTTLTSLLAMWGGFGGENNTGWNEQEGTWKSSWLGAYWEINPTERAENGADANTLQFRIVDPAKPGNLDPYQSFDTSTAAQTIYSTMNLLNFDGNLNAHPGVAYQWFVEDVVYDADKNASTADELVESGKHTFLIDSSAWQFPATTDYLGNTIPSENIDANDFALVYEMYKNPLTNLNNKELFDPVVKWEVSTTITTNDTFSVYLRSGTATPNDYVSFGALTPLPEHILGGALDVDDPDATGLQPNGTQVELGVTNFSEVTFNPQQTVQWQHWSSFSGSTLVGPMTIDEFELAPGGGGFFTFAARADFPFPNEWDARAIYATNGGDLDLLYDNLNINSWANASSDTGDPTTSPVTSLEYFAPHTGGAVDAYYFTFNDQGGLEKPTAQLIDKIVVKNIADDNVALLAFESGELDAFVSSSQGIDTVQSHQNNPEFKIESTKPHQGPELLVFNLLNEHLRKRNVRYAIASVIDKNEMIKINDRYAIPHHSPVWRSYDNYLPLEFIGAGPNGEELTWYTDDYAIPYNYETGRDLMRIEGYQASGLERGPTRYPLSPIHTDIGPNNFPITFSFSFYIAAITFAFAIKLKKYNKFNN